MILYHVTAVMCLFIVKIKSKEKEKKNQKKRNIKLEKIDKSKIKLLVSQQTRTLLKFDRLSQRTIRARTKENLIEFLLT